jgi:hypothetical protein
MKLTKKQRHEIYLKAKNILVKQPTFGMCLCLSIVLNKTRAYSVNDEGVKYEELLDLLPEFKAIKPENKTSYEYWFENKKQRLVAFDKMIKETKSNDA